MRRVKPGRAPSAMNTMTSMVAIVFGLFWTVGARGVGAPFWMLGIAFILIGVVMLLFNANNAFGRNRFSIADIVDTRDEPDPMSMVGELSDDASGYCPYCGSETDGGFEFCRRCGKRLP